MDTNKAKPDYTFKYIIVGYANVGKTNIIFRFAENKFSEEYQSTLNMDFTYKNTELKGKIIRSQLWDTAGQENFQSISRGYYKSAVCGIVVYDITDRNSFDSVNGYIEQCRTNGPKTISLVLVGNKVDLEDKRKVSFEEGEELAGKNGMLFFETSAKSGKNIQEMFNGSFEDILKKIDNGYYKGVEKECGITFKDQPNNKLDINNKDNNKKKCC